MNLEQLRSDYENLKATNRLKERINKTIKRSKRNHMIKLISTTAATIVIAGTISLNTFPTMAHAAQDIPVLGDIAKVLTFGRYEYKDDNFVAEINTPKIEGLLDKELEEKLNNQFKQHAETLIAAFESDVKALKEEFGDDGAHMGIVSDYIIKTDNDKILALDVYTLNIAGSSSTKHSFFTIDKVTGQLLTLSSLFKPDADYVTALSDYIKDEMRRRNAEEDGMFFIDDEIADFEAIKPDQNFYINNEGDLVICFDKYEISAGAQGSPEFVIPSDVIAEIKAVVK